MALNEIVREKLRKRLEKFEGRVNHLYLDRNGFVTVGVGHFIPTRNAVASITLVKTINSVPGKPATLQEKSTEYDNIKAQPKNHKASWYKQHANLIMPNEEIERVLNKHIDAFYQELINIYKKSAGYFDDFDKLPRNIQLALFDMIFNIGAHRITNDFPNFDKAMKNGDWDKAAKESHRQGIEEARNTYVADLFLSVGCSQKGCP